MSLTISADGKHLVFGRSVWNAENLTLEYFADGRYLWKDFDGWYRIKEIEPLRAEDRQGTIVNLFAYNNLGTLTPDGRQLITVSGSEFSVFDVKTGNLLYEDHVFRNDASVFALAVSPDGRYALAAGSGATAGPGGTPVMSDPCQLYLYRLPTTPRPK